MDRRNRFIPWSDRLEGRQLMTAAAAVMPQATYSSTLANTPTSTPTVVTKGQVRQTRALSPQAAFESSVTGTRQNRIKQLPGYLALVNPDRKLPGSIITSLQNDMQAIQNTLKAPPQAFVNAMKDAIKDTRTSATITQDHAQSLSNQFGLLLKYSGATPDVTAQFQKDMNDLIRLDTQSRAPAQTAADDYGIMTQYVLSVGRRINPNANAASVRAAAAKAAAASTSSNVASPVASSGI